MQILPNVDFAKPDSYEGLNRNDLPEYAGAPGMFNEILGQAVRPDARDQLLDSYSRRNPLDEAGPRRADDPLNPSRREDSPAPALDDLMRQADEAERRMQERYSKEDAEAREALRRALLGGDNGETEAPQMLKMTEEDIKGLEETLAAHGFTSKEIKEIKEEIASESGLSWGEFMRRIAAKKLDQGQDLVFTPQQKQHLTHLLGKLGFTPEQSEAALRKLSRGELGDVLKQIHGRLQAMPQDSGVTFSRSEMKGLLEACRVPKELQARFMSYFGDGHSLSGEGLRNALAQLKQDLAKMRKEASEKTSELLADVGKALRKAADEAEEGRFSKRLMQGEEANREKAIKQSSGVEKQIADSAEAARQADKAQAAAQSGETASKEAKDAKNAKEAMAVKEAMDKSAQSKAEHDKIPKAKPDSPEQQAKASLFGKQGGGQEHMAADDEAPRDSRQERDALKDLFARFRQGAPTEAKADKNAAPAPASANMFENIAKNVADKTPGARESLTRQTLHQVQQGVLRNMHGGGKQLTLQLSPESLGRLHVMLQVKNKEIQASIRAESPDTARMLTENMNALKASLEQQGLKVSKVEVQTGLPQDQFSQQFFGQDRHNEAQRQNELAQKMGRMRLIRQESEAVAQEMQNETEQARFSREGINLIA